MPGGDLLQRALEPAVGLDSVQLAGLDERADTAPGASALVVAREQRIFRRELHRADAILHEVAVHLDAPVIQEHQHRVLRISEIPAADFIKSRPALNVASGA